MTEKTKENVEKRYTDPITGKFIKGNPGGGRPEGSVSVVEALKKKLVEFPEGEEKTYLEKFVIKIFEKAIKDGDVQMMRDLINRIDGLPKQNIDLTSLGEQMGVIYLPTKKDESSLEANNQATGSAGTD